MLTLWLKGVDSPPPSERKAKVFWFFQAEVSSTTRSRIRWYLRLEKARVSKNSPKNSPKLSKKGTSLHETPQNSTAVFFYFHSAFLCRTFASETMSGWAFNGVSRFFRLGKSSLTYWHYINGEWWAVSGERNCITIAVITVSGERWAKLHNHCRWKVGEGTHRFKVESNQL